HACPVRLAPRRRPLPLQHHAVAEGGGSARDPAPQLPAAARRPGHQRIPARHRADGRRLYRPRPPRRAHRGRSMSVPIRDQIAELKREIRTRERVFPKWVADGRLDAAEAERRVTRMRAALESLYELDALKRPGL